MEEAWAIRVKAVRSGLGMTQAAFAQRMGMSYVAISKWENLLRRPYSRNAEWFEVIEGRFNEGRLPRLGPGEERTWRELFEGGE